MNAREVFLKVKRIYRPADTHLGRDACFRSDWNVVYWSDEIHKLKLNKVVVKCVLVCSAAIDEPIEEFVRNGPNRMYPIRPTTRQSGNLNRHQWKPNESVPIPKEKVENHSKVQNLLSRVIQHIPKWSRSRL